jgi:hypothetical protein
MSGRRPVSLAEAVHGLTSELRDVGQCVRIASVAVQRAFAQLIGGDLEGAARLAELACDAEYQAFGHCESCGPIAEWVAHEHIGSDADFCEAYTKGGCPVCAALNPYFDGVLEEKRRGLAPLRESLDRIMAELDSKRQAAGKPTPT